MIDLDVILLGTGAGQPFRVGTGINLQDINHNREYHHEGHDQAYDLHISCLADHKVGKNTQQDGNPVYNGDGLLLREPHGKKPMVKMTFVGMERTLTMQNPSDEGECRVC